MNSFFKNRNGQQEFSLLDYQSNIHQYRHNATELWRKNCQIHANQAGFSFAAPPPFFIDKLSFRAWLNDMIESTSIIHTSVPETDFTLLFQSYDEIVRKSVVGSKVLGTSAPNVDELVRRSQFLEYLFSSWQRHLASHNIVLPSETIDWYFSVPLLEVYRNSVFYPRLPVLWGPNYFGKISDCDQNHILNRYGESAVWDFYFFMMVCHEQSHIMQKGEPILNEIAHAILWIDFVLEHGLRSFQVNSLTGKTCNIEAPFILGRIENLKRVNYQLLFEDNMKFFELEFSNSEYSHFVALAFLVRTGVLQYRHLTNLFCSRLAKEVSEVKYLQSNIVDIISLCLKSGCRLTI